MRIIFFALFVVLVSGCSTTSFMQRQADQMNEQFARQYSPIRAEFTDHGNGATSFQIGVWAGEPGASIFNDQHKDHIFNLIEESCGFDRASLLETRIVEHQEQFWYEVWLFNDSESGSQDKQKGISVVVSYEPSTDKTKTSLYGCNSK